MELTNCGVYQILCTANGHRYIGSSQNIRKRFNKHRSTLRQGVPLHPILLNAWNKHGEDSFEFSVLLSCAPDELLIHEQAMIDSLKPEYNVLLLVVNSPRGVKRSEQTKEKLRQINLGKKHTPESKEKNRRATSAQWATPEAKEKMIQGYKNLPTEVKQKRNEKIRLSCLNRTPEANEQIRKALIGRPVSKETREKIGAAHRGKKMSESSREKMRISATGKKDSPEKRKNRVLGQKARWERVRLEKQKNNEGV